MVNGRSSDGFGSASTYGEARRRDGSVARWLVGGAVLVTLAAADAPPLGAGYWHASGNEIVDAAGHAIRLSGVNFGGFQQPWHDAPGFPANLPAFWDAQWGFVHDQRIGPIWIGEWGSRLDSANEQAWATTLRDYIRSKRLSWTWWTWDPTSTDTGGVLEDDWRQASPDKVTLFRPVLYPTFDAEPRSGDGGGCASAPPRRRARRSARDARAISRSAPRPY